MGRGIRFQQQSLYTSTFGYFRGRKRRKREWKKKEKNRRKKYAKQFSSTMTKRLAHVFAEETSEKYPLERKLLFAIQ